MARSGLDAGPGGGGRHEVGRRIAAEGLEPGELEERVERAVEDGEVIVIDGDRRLEFSDEIPLGETGKAPKASAPRGAATARRL